MAKNKTNIGKKPPKKPKPEGSVKSKSKRTAHERESELAAQRRETDLNGQRLACLPDRYGDKLEAEQAARAKRGSFQIVPFDGGEYGLRRIG
jgi:hypothetical protein